MYAKGDNIEIMISNEEDEVMKERFQSFLSRYQIGLETSMKSSEFIFESVHLLYYKCHTLREKCRNTELFLVLIFLHSLQIQENKGQK